jgi:Flp pilus assembly protein TadG
VIRWSDLARLLKTHARDERAAQLVEFAVALPLLVVFVVGIFDFSSAFTLKQKLTNIARDAARVGAAEPSNDLVLPATPAPGSVMEAFRSVDDYLVASNINDCGITSSAAVTGMTWVFSGTTNGCAPGGLVVTINRGYYFPATGATAPTVGCQSQTPGAGQLTVVGTCVSIKYAYPWRFGQAASLLGANTILPTQLSAVAVALNEN